MKIVGKTGIRYIPSRPGDFKGKVVSSEKAKRELGWQATTSFEDGVRKYLAWLQETAGHP